MNTVRTIAFDPTSRGFGFVVFEGPTKLVDWGYVSARPASTKTTIERAAELLAWYTPDIVVVDDWKRKGFRKGKRAKHFLSALCGFVESSGASIERIRKENVQATFSPSGRAKKQAIAELIVAAFPELSLRLPPPRKIWMSEDERMSIFDAAALVLTYFSLPEELGTIV